MIFIAFTAFMFAFLARMLLTFTRCRVLGSVRSAGEIKVARRASRYRVQTKFAASFVLPTPV